VFEIRQVRTQIREVDAVHLVAGFDLEDRRLRQVGVAWVSMSKSRSHVVVKAAEKQLGRATQSLGNSAHIDRQQRIPRSWIVRLVLDGAIRGASPREPAAGTVVAPRIDISEDDREIKVTAEMPGMRPEDVTLTINDDVLTLRAERERERETQRNNYHLVERTVGVFQRTLRLPSPVDPRPGPRRDGSRRADNLHSEERPEAAQSTHRGAQRGSGRRLDERRHGRREGRRQRHRKGRQRFGRIVKSSLIRAAEVVLEAQHLNQSTRAAGALDAASLEGVIHPRRRTAPTTGGIAATVNARGRRPSRSEGFGVLTRECGCKSGLSKRVKPIYSREALDIADMRSRPFAFDRIGAPCQRSLLPLAHRLARCQRHLR